MGTNTSGSNDSGWRRRGGEVFKVHCAATRMWSMVSLLKRLEMVKCVEDDEAKFGARLELKP